VSAVALTHSPVLAETFVTLAKALATSYAHADQRGGMAVVPEHLRGRIPRSMIHSPYGDENLRDGYQVDAVVGSQKLRNPDGTIRRAPITRSVTMPVGEDPGIPKPDIQLAARLLSKFIEYLRGVGPQRGNVLEGTAGWFMLHGLEPRAAKAVERYIHENADDVFKRAFLKAPEELWKSWVDESPQQPLTGYAAYLDELDKALEADSPQDEPVQTAESVVTELPALEPIAPVTAIKKLVQPSSAPRRRPTIVKYEGSLSMRTSTVDYLSKLDELLNKAERANQDFVDVTDLITPLWHEFRSLRALWRNPRITPLQRTAAFVTFEKSFKEISSKMRESGDVSKSMEPDSSDMVDIGAKFAALWPRWLRIGSSAAAMDAFEKSFEEIVAQYDIDLTKSISDGQCGICRKQNPVGSTQCGNCGCSLDLTTSSEPIPEVTKKDIAAYTKLLKSGGVPFEIALAVDRAQINIAQAVRMLAPTSLNAYADALQKGIVPPEIALRVDRRQLSVEDALKEIAPTQSL
jgi:hypothetical protein